MNGSPTSCVVDTNVPKTANGANNEASAWCVAACARVLQAVMTTGHVFVDDGGRIMNEYRRNLCAKGQPGPGDAFLRWLLTHEWGRTKVTRVHITPRNEDPDDFVELPVPPPGIIYDPSDRRFLAVACAHPSRPPILQALDSKWWGWQEALAPHGVTICFLCPEEIAAKHQAKMGS